MARSSLTGLLRLLLSAGVAFLAAAPAQTVGATNLGGGCGNTVGYPRITAPSLLRFHVQRTVCDPNASASPSVIVLGFSTVHLPIPFALGVAPGCIWKVVPTAQVPIASRLGGTGSSTFLFDLALAPRGVRFYLQALTTCVVEGGIPGEHAASDAWELTIR